MPEKLPTFGRGAPRHNQRAATHRVWSKAWSRVERLAMEQMETGIDPLLNEQSKRLRVQLARAYAASRRARLRVSEVTTEGKTKRTTRRVADYPTYIVRLERALTRCAEATLAAKIAGEALGGSAEEKAAEIRRFLDMTSEPFQPDNGTLPAEPPTANGHDGQR